MRALKYLLVKEFKQLFRNRLLPVIFVLLPVIMTVVVPNVATQEVSHLRFAVIDADHSPLSERLVHKVAASRYFSLQSYCASYAEALKELEFGNADFIINIAPYFERSIYRGEQADVMVSANAVNGMKAGLGSSYLTQIVMAFSREVAAERGMAPDMPHIEPRYLYNPTLEYKSYMIPALMMMTLMLLVGFLPALNIVGEKEHGTIEQINVSPIGRVEFVLSKLIPYWTTGGFIVAFSMALAGLVHGVLPAGSVLTLLIFNMVYILVISSFGLIISNYSDNVRQAAMVMFFFVIIFVLTSGLVSPVSSMPYWAELATRLNPLRYIMAAMRDIYLKGSSFVQLLHLFVPLCIYAVVVGALAIKSYTKQNV